MKREQMLNSEHRTGGGWDRRREILLVGARREMRWKRTKNGKNGQGQKKSNKREISVTMVMI
jgi:hypothetical protein